MKVSENDVVGNSGPLISIGILAYNEESYLAKTLESILEQDFHDYEIIIADNASEDRTGEIAREFVVKNPKIQYLRHQVNIGALENFNELVRSAKGKYFVLAGGHDLWSNFFLVDLVAVLGKMPSAVLAYGVTVWIDDKGNELDIPDTSVDTYGYKAPKRFNMVMRGHQHAMYGMFRMSALNATRLQLAILGSGAVLLGELAILGGFIVVPEATWYRRANRKVESREERLERYSTMLFTKKKSLLFAHWRIPFAFLGSVVRAKVPFGTRLLLLLSIPSSLVVYSHLLLYDLVRPFYLVFRSVKRLFTKSSS